MSSRNTCPMRHENGNCLAVGGFCTAVNDEICQGLHNAYEMGKASLDKAMQALKNNIEKENKPYAHWGNQVLCQVDFYDLKVGYICPCCHKFVPNKGKYCLECGERIEG